MMTANTAPIGKIPPADPTELEEFRRQTRALYDLQERAIAAGDVVAITEQFYAADALSFGGDAKAFRDRAGWQSIYQGFVDAFSAMKIDSHQAYVRGDMGWDWGTMTNIAKDGTISHLALVFLWVRDSDGRWMCAGNAYAEHEGGPVNWPDKTF